jgi:hypothetical protein
MKVTQVEIVKSTQHDRVGVIETFKHISNSKISSSGRNKSKKPSKSKMTLGKLAEMFIEFRNEVRSTFKRNNLK